jgi:hypothetical protein
MYVQLVLVHGVHTVDVSSTFNSRQHSNGVTCGKRINFRRLLKQDWWHLLYPRWQRLILDGFDPLMI